MSIVASRPEKVNSGEVLIGMIRHAGESGLTLRRSGMIQCGMMKQKRKKQPLFPTIDNIDLMIADVPVRISLIHQAKTIFEYDEVIDINFTTSTPKGLHNGVKMLSLKHGKGLSTEDALFVMAKDDYMENEKYLTSKLKFPNLKGLEGSDELQFAINRNGEIKYRKHTR